MLKKNGRQPAPHPIHREADFSELAEHEYMDWWMYLGSFWPYNTSNYESRLVRSFKESIPAEDFHPQLGVLCDFYARAIVDKLPKGKIDYVVRALSSSETSTDTTRPQGMLVQRLCKLTGAHDVSNVFFRSQPRTPMRMVQNLSGSAAVRQRLKYAAQDLFVQDVRLSGRVLFFDDIANTGATMRLYAWALKRILGCSQVWGCNIAVTRFGGGKDGKGFLELDTSPIQSLPGFTAVHKDQKDIFHSTDSCLHLEGKTSVVPLYYATRKLKQCPHCR